MTSKHIGRIAGDLSLNSRSVEAAALLLGGGATIPFIARYRKEATGGLDEVAVAAIRDSLARLQELDTRREAICRSLDERGLLSPELKSSLDAADSLSVLEDLYLPHRPKKRTRAMAAREKGLEPLADLIFSQDRSAKAPEEAAEAFVDSEKGVENAREALAGARDILAERINEDAAARAEMRTLFLSRGEIRCRVLKGKEEAGAKYRDYFDWSEPLASAPSHRILAVRRGEKEGFLAFRILPPEDQALSLLEKRFALFPEGELPASDQVREAVGDAYKRLLAPSMETEARLESKKRADAEAICVFAENLRELLLAPPLGGKRVLAVDPGFRTGCKIAVLDAQGTLVHHDVIYLAQSEKQARRSEELVRDLVRRFRIEAVAVGNGTAGRETEAFVRGLHLEPPPAIVMVNESGASVYSASEAAREEFPDLDLTVRGAVSIARRLMDPLAELVKIDPKAIGVGQYQHDVDQTALRQSLDDVVMSCVNSVGVEVNTASRQLLSYVSGLGAQLASKIVEFREENGPFRSREDLLKVPRLGPKAFEQAAGFLRIRGAHNPLDGSAVHPERYGLVQTMAEDLGCTVADLMEENGLREKIDLSKYTGDSVGLPTLRDIMAELDKPGRDPRRSFEAFSFTEGIEKIEDVKPGMNLPGIVTNVTAFGAFVDIGVHQDGLVHVSQLADRFVKNPADVVKVHQKVTVTVLDVDLARRRISLSMKKGGPGPADGKRKPPRTPQRESGAKNPQPASNWFLDGLEKGRRDR
ncbi:MAG: Tex family protein [Acidobacteriota bacterium]